MSQRQISELSSILSDGELNSEIVRKASVFLSSYAFQRESWYELTCDLLYETIRVLKEHHAYDAVDYRLAALREIILHAVSEMEELRDPNSLPILRRVLADSIDGFAERRNLKAEAAVGVRAYADDPAPAMDAVIDLNSRGIRMELPDGKTIADKEQALLQVMVVRFMAQVQPLVNDTTSVEQLCEVFFEFCFSFSVRQSIYQRFREGFYEIITQLAEEADHEEE